jgi:hypothetical protein
MQAEEGELAVPLLGVGDEAEASQEQQQEIRSSGEPAAAAEQGDLEQGLSAAGSDAGASNKAEDEAAYAVSNMLALSIHIPEPCVHATVASAAVAWQHYSS